MDATRILEIALFTILSYLPYALLTLYSFRDNLRFSPTVTISCLLLSVTVRVVFHVWTSLDPMRADINFPVLIYNTLTCLLVIRAHWGKAMFTMVFISNIANFIATAAKCLEGQLFPLLALQPMRWSNCLTLLMVELAVLIPLFIYIRDIFGKAVRDTTSLVAWRYLWLIPLTFYAVWFRNYYFSAEGALVLMLRPRHLFYSLVINAGAILIYTMVAQLINEYAQNAQLRELEHQQTIQKTLYGSMMDRIEEVRRANHDLRHHFHVIRAYLNDEKYQELSAYISRYQKTIPEEVPISYCENFAVNALLQHFASYAKTIGSEFSAAVQLPADARIPDEVLTVVLGNLLENATEACVTQGPGSFVSIRGKCDETAVFFKVVNSCTVPPQQDDHGGFRSTKRSGSGIGLRSVRDITRQYGGIMKTSFENGRFSVSILLNDPSRLP